MTCLACNDLGTLRREDPQGLAYTEDCPDCGRGLTPGDPEMAGPDHLTEGSAGITLRDWFAEQALARMAPPRGANARLSARLAYEVADAMLAERERSAELPWSPTRKAS